MKTFSKYLIETPDDVLAAINALYTAIWNSHEHPRRDVFNPVITDSQVRGGYRFSVRYWPSDWGWSNPPEDRDEEDYDYQVPTTGTAKRANEIVAQINSRFLNVKLSWENEGEKNWLVFLAKPK